MGEVVTGMERCEWNGKPEEKNVGKGKMRENSHYKL